MYNILIGGAAGLGVDTMSAILEKLLKRSGYQVFSTKDVMSRIRGGHNFTLMRFSSKPITSHSFLLDGIVALDQKTVEIHQQELKTDGFILCDTSISLEGKNIIKLDINDTAKKLGNPKVTGSILIGAILKLFSEKLDHAQNIFSAFVKPEDLTINLAAVQIGYNLVEEKFTPKEGGYQDWMILNGNQAIALGAIAAGVKFYSAYPMSPSTGIMEYLAGKMTEARIVVEQAEDEIAAINMAIGASFAGAKAMTGTSGGGFCLMVEGLGLSGMAEVPVVIVDVQRPGPSTGLPTRTEQGDLKFVISAAHGDFPRMVIAIKNHNDAFHQTIRAFYLAEKYQIPVILLSDQYLADSSAVIEAFSIKAINQYPVNETQQSDKGEYLRFRFTSDGISPRFFPGTKNGLVISESDEHDEHGWISEDADIRTRMMNKRFQKLEKLNLELSEPEFIGDDSFDTLLIGWGSTDGPIKEAISILNNQSGKRFGALIFGDVYPLPVKRLVEMAQKAKNIINIEQNATGQFTALIREKTGIVCTSNILKYDGRQISGEQIAEKVLEVE